MSWFRYKTLFYVEAAAILLALLGLSDSASAKPEYLRTVKAVYPIHGTRIANCALCHTKGGGSAQNRFGRSFLAFGADAKALRTMEGDDSDSDKFSNLEELVSLTYPGDPRDKPATHPTDQEIQAFVTKGKTKTVTAKAQAPSEAKEEIAAEIRTLRRRLDELEESLRTAEGAEETLVLEEAPEEEVGFEIDLDEEPGEEKEEGFGIELEEEAPEPATGEDRGVLADAIDNFQWGGALDVWVRSVSGGQSTAVAPIYNGRGTRDFDAFIHVAEIVATTRIGDHVTLLGELLLATEEGLGFRQLVAERHGFFYGIFSNLPVLPRGSTVWLGRFRIPYGVDAVLDAPASPLDTMATRITGQISDVALMWTGFAGPFEWSIAGADGADFDARDVENNTFNLYARTDLDLSGLVPGLHVGLSGFLGEHYRYADGILRTPNAITNKDVVDKTRLTMHALMPVGKFSFYGEATIGEDEDDFFQAYFFRTDYNFTSKLTGHFVWDYLKTEYKETKLAGNSNRKLARLATSDWTGDDEHFLRGGLSYHLSEHIILRLIDDFKLNGSENLPENVLTAQCLLEF